MGLAGFERARRRHADAEGVEILPPPKSAYVKTPEYKRPWCAVCDRIFQNHGAYSRHMKFKHNIEEY